MADLRVSSNIPVISPLHIEQEQAKKRQWAPPISPFASSIERADGETTHQFRPQLSPLSSLCKNPLPGIIQLQVENHHQMKDHADLFKEETEWHSAQMKEAQAQQSKLSEKASQTKELENLSGTWSRALQYTASFVSLFLGAGLFTLGTDPKTCYQLIAAGGLGLLNQGASDLNVWQSIAEYFTDNAEKQKQIAARIENNLFYLSLVASVAGIAITARSASLTSEVLKEKEKIVKFVKDGLALAGSGSQCLTGVIQKRSYDIQSEMTIQSAKITEISKLLSELCWNQKNKIEGDLNNDQIAKDAIGHLSSS